MAAPKLPKLFKDPESLEVGRKSPVVPEFRMDKPKPHTIIDMGTRGLTPEEEGELHLARTLKQVGAPLRAGKSRRKKLNKKPRKTKKKSRGRK
jgi:hypothetical protein